MQVVEGVAHAFCIRKYCDQTLPGTFHQDPKICTQLSNDSHGTRQCESPLMIVREAEKPSLALSSRLCQVSSELIHILSFDG